jgi:hypothetical protein
LVCLPLRWVRPERQGALGLAFLALGQSQARATWCWGWFALFPGLKVRPDVALRQKIIIFFSINIFNDNKDNNLCAPNNNIFYINSLNYNKNKYYYFQL